MTIGVLLRSTVTKIVAVRLIGTAPAPKRVAVTNALTENSGCKLVGITQACHVEDEINFATIESKTQVRMSQIRFAIILYNAGGGFALLVSRLEGANPCHAKVISGGNGKPIG